MARHSLLFLLVALCVAFAQVRGGRHVRAQMSFSLPRARVVEEPKVV
jgi:hypothetical protein